MSKTKFDELMVKAEELHEKIDTDYADEHEEEWNAFDAEINAAYDSGKISASEFDRLAVMAFYDYFDLKCVEDD